MAKVATGKEMDISWTEVTSLLKRAQGLSLSTYAKDKGWNPVTFSKAVKEHYGDTLTSRRGRNGGSFLGAKTTKKATKIPATDTAETVS